MNVLIIFIICTLISIIYLPEILTIKKDYAVNYRDLYYELVLERLPQVTVIDDFERLSEPQQKQIYEFLSYLNTINYFKDNNEKKIIIIGALEQISGKEESQQTEKFFEKFYDIRFELDNWIEGSIFNIQRQISTLGLGEDERPNKLDFDNLEDIVVCTNMYVTRRLFERDFIGLYKDNPSDGLLKVYEKYLLLHNQKYKEKPKKDVSFNKKNSENDFSFHFIKKNFRDGLPVYNPITDIETRENELVFKYSTLNLSAFTEYIANVFTISDVERKRLFRFLTNDHQEDYLFDTLDEFKRYLRTKESVGKIIGTQELNRQLIKLDETEEDLNTLLTEKFPDLSDNGKKKIFGKLEMLGNFEFTDLEDLKIEFEGTDDNLNFTNIVFENEDLKTKVIELFSYYSIARKLSEFNRIFILYTHIDVEQYCPKMVKTNQELKSFSYSEFEDLKNYKLESMSDIYTEKLFEYILDGKFGNYAHLKYLEEFIKGFNDLINLDEIKGLNSDILAVIAKIIKENNKQEVFVLNYGQFSEEENYFINKETGVYLDEFEGTYLTENIFRYLLLNNEKLSEDQKIKLYCTVPYQDGFYFADKAFKEMIDGNISNYTQEQCDKLLELAENNSQVSGRENYAKTIKQITDRLKDENIDLDLFLENKSYKRHFK